MYRIAIIIPYFGKLPECFPVWWASALKNDSIDFFFFTDESMLHSEKNITVIHMEFEMFRDKLQDIFDFEITCSSPYKLCDYKPVYGEAFAELLDGYDFWGHGDIDLVLGNIRKFITDDILQKYERIMNIGHLCLFRNNDKMNKLFRSKGEYPEYNYQEVYTTDDACYFDEFRGVNLKCLRENISFFVNDDFYYDAVPSKNKFFDRENKQIVGIWDDGCLNIITNEGKSKEVMYMHISKRKMEYDEQKDLINNKFAIVPGRIIANYTCQESELFNYKSGGCAYSVSWYIKRLVALRKKYTIKEIVVRRKRMREVSDYNERLMNKK